MLWRSKHYLVISLFCVGLSAEFEMKCTQSGERCYFPFPYQGSEQFSCTAQGNIRNHLWCYARVGGESSNRLSRMRCAECAGDALCYIRGNEFPSFTIDCPPSCANVANRLWGTDRYAEYSYACAAGIHAGVILASNGGVVSINSDNQRSGYYMGSTRHGMTSQSLSAIANTFTPTAVNVEHVPMIAHANMNEIRFTRRHETVITIPSIRRDDDRHAIVSIDIDLQRRLIYWTDIENKKISRTHYGDEGESNEPIVLHSNETTRLHSSEGIAVDWIHENLYWSDYQLGSVSVSKTTGAHKKTLINRGSLYYPRDIALDPANGYMFISDLGNSPKIEKCSMDGADCTDVINHNIEWPHGLAIDFQNNRVYWVDASIRSISSCRTDGTGRRELIISVDVVGKPFDVTLSGNRVYWSNTGVPGILSIDKNTGRDLHVVAAGLERPRGIKTIDFGRQPMSPNRCRNAGCMYLCLASPGGHQCECPDGYQPNNPTRSNCTLQRDNGDRISMIVSDANRILRIDFDPVEGGGTIAQLVTNTEGITDVAVHYQRQHVYWANYETRTISRISATSSDDSVTENIINGSPRSPYLQRPGGLAVDWIHRNLFWTDTVLHSVFLTNLGVGSRRQVARIINRTGSYHPVAVAVDPRHGFMYIADSGRQPKIEKCWMNGQSCVTVIDKHIQIPRGITLDLATNRIFWTDARLNIISSCNMDGNGRQTLADTRLLDINPFGVAVFQSRVYWTDRGLEGKLFSMDKIDGGNANRLMRSGLDRGLGLQMLEERNQPEARNKCNIGRCRHMCVPSPSRTGYQCICPINQPLLPECRGSGAELNCEAGMEPNNDMSQCVDEDECSNGGNCEHICINTIGSYVCRCRVGFILSANRHTCQRQVACRAGMRPRRDGRSGCEDRDECSINRGGCHQRCENTVGSFHCECNDGFTLAANRRTCRINAIECDVGMQASNDGMRCIDINECAVRRGGCQQLCFNDVGSFRCACNNGFTLDENVRDCVPNCEPGMRINDGRSGCVDVDECLNGGGCQHECVNVPGSYRCACNEGFLLQENGRNCERNIPDCDDGYQLSSDLTRCEDFNECLQRRGGCEQVCINTDGSFYCDCNDGFNLSEDERSCEAIITACSSRPCQNNGTCVLNDNEPGYTCECLQGFRGDACRDIFGVIIPSIDTIQAGVSFFLECRVPQAVVSTIFWRRNREYVADGAMQTAIIEGGRKLRIFHATYLIAGEYECQFRVNNREIVASYFLTVEISPALVCGKSLGINDGARHRSGRIFGGHITPPLAAPFMVILYKTTPDPTYVRQGMFCGASLIDTRSLITAAHCVSRLLAEEIRVYAGKLSANVNEIERYQQSAQVSSILLHPDYVSQTFHADYAILTLETSLTFTEGVKPICVPRSNNNDDDLKPRPYKNNVPKYGLVFGWGLIRFQRSRVLREVKLPIRRNSYCSDRYDITSLMFCAGGETTMDACRGDSGGPFALWSERTNTWSIAGIVSWGEGADCGIIGRPGVYARVTKNIRSWIYNNSDLE